jgi:hypothetical protein
MRLQEKNKERMVFLGFEGAFQVFPGRVDDGLLKKGAGGDSYETNGTVGSWQQISWQ